MAAWEVVWAAAVPRAARRWAGGWLREQAGLGNAVEGTFQVTEKS